MADTVEQRLCGRCGAEKDLEEFELDARCKSGRKKNCRTCVAECQRRRQIHKLMPFEERCRKRVISPENKDFFDLGKMKADDQIRDLEKALDIAEKTIRALLTVVKEADARDAKKHRIPA